MAEFNYSALVQQAKDSGAATSYDPLPEGEYNFVVEKAEATNSKKGDPQLVLTLKVTDEGEHKNRKLWHRMTFIPGNGVGLAINFRQIDTLGGTPILEQGGSLAQVAGFLTGKTGLARVIQKEWNDKLQNEVKDIKKGAAAAAGIGGGFNPSPAGFAAPAPSAPAASASNPF